MKTTQQNNRMIAEFIGWKLGHPELFELRWSNEWFDGRDKKTNKGFLHFNSSWDWLMPVVNEIYNTGLDEQTTNEIGDVTHALLDVDMGALYQAVVKFIEFYNNK